MSGYVIVVDFRLASGTRSQFRKLIDANARASCETEPGCRRFDVLEPKNDSDRILLYEIYDSRAAFEEHIKTAHFAMFDKASASLVQQKAVSEFELVCEGSLVDKREHANG
jgi:(4S)-4-hydroxy-5-phosphonooxypentane-2,3-dione isomerase